MELEERSPFFVGRAGLPRQLPRAAQTVDPWGTKFDIGRVRIRGEGPPLEELCHLLEVFGSRGLRLKRNEGVA